MPVICVAFLKNFRKSQTGSITLEIWWNFPSKSTFLAQCKLWHNLQNNNEWKQYVDVRISQNYFAMPLQSNCRVQTKVWRHFCDLNVVWKYTEVFSLNFLKVSESSKTNSTYRPWRNINGFCSKRQNYRSGTVNSKSFVGKVLLWIKWKFKLN